MASAQARASAAWNDSEKPKKITVLMDLFWDTFTDITLLIEYVPTDFSYSSSSSSVILFSINIFVIGVFVAFWKYDFKNNESWKLRACSLDIADE